MIRSQLQFAVAAAWTTAVDAKHTGRQSDAQQGAHVNGTTVGWAAGIEQLIETQ